METRVIVCGGCILERYQQRNGKYVEASQESRRGMSCVFALVIHKNNEVTDD